jgi:hypothetical protein
VNHAAGVEQFFSNLLVGGGQNVKRSWLAIPHLETIGSHYTRQLNEAAPTMRKSTQRKHAHTSMHAQTQPGININAERAAVLLSKEKDAGGEIWDETSLHSLNVGNDYRYRIRKKNGIWGLARRRHATVPTTYYYNYAST